MQREKAVTKDVNIQKGSIEGVILVNGRPQLEQADMPLTLSFETIEDLERFCKAAKSRNPDQH